MRRLLLTSCAAVALCAATPAQAQILEVASISGIVAALRAVTEFINGGTQQISNYLKGQVAANQQIADASNTSMALFQRDMRNAQIRDEHTVSPATCEALDNGQSISVAAGQSWIVASSLSSVLNRRREAGPGTPAWYGSAQAAADRSTLHGRRYCSDLEVQEGVCAQSDRPNGDVRSTSMTAALSYGAAPENMNAAVDFSVNVVQPVPMPALRGDALRSAQGQEGAAWLRRYQANMSLAQDVHLRYIARRAPTVTLTPAQRAQQQAQGMVPTEKGSWIQAASLEVSRRLGGVAWKAQMARMTPAEKQNETAAILALMAGLMLEGLHVNEDVANTNAAILAALTEGETGRPQDAYRRLTDMPTPQMR